MINVLEKYTSYTYLKLPVELMAKMPKLKKSLFLDLEICWF